MKLRDFIKQFVKLGDTNKIIYRIEQGKIRSKMLGDCIVSMLRENPEFVMIDDKKYQSKLKGNFRSHVISNLFSGSGAFVKALPNTFDTLIVDEAHRLAEKAYMYNGEHQVRDLINAANCVVFFVAEDQRIHLNDAGNLDEILGALNSEFCHRFIVCKSLVTNCDSAAFDCKKNNDSKGIYISCDCRFHFKNKITVKRCSQIDKLI